MTQRYYYHEHLADYAELKAKGLKSRGEIYGDPNDFEEFSSKLSLEDIDYVRFALHFFAICAAGP